MWLLHSKELQIKSFFEIDIEPYAILSHRWDEQEVSFQELHEVLDGKNSNQDGNLTNAKFSKIQKTRELARSQDIDWVWIDTCCIDKKSSAELSEAINSMFRWYERAKVCYVYMSDVTRRPLGTSLRKSSGSTEQDELGSFHRSSWFTRGWTLQELLAPIQVDFYDYQWNFIGSKEDLSEGIERRTGIETQFLDHSVRLNEATIAKKMSWASTRQTTREEDMAYCLLGLFDVNMPLLYGEGPKAFMRLQLEIIRKSDDESIFAWTRAGAQRDWEVEQQTRFLDDESREHERQRDRYTPRPFRLHSGLLAQEPRDFARSGHIQWKKFERFVRRLPYDMTNQGLRLYADADPHELQHLMHVGDTFDLVLNCYESTERGDKPFFITLTKDYPSPDQPMRRLDCTRLDSCFDLASETAKVQVTFYIRQDGL